MPRKHDYFGNPASYDPDVTRQGTTVQAAMPCDRCLRWHTAYGKTVDEAKRKAAQFTEDCPCYKESPEPKMPLALSILIGIIMLVIVGSAIYSAVKEDTKDIYLGQFPIGTTHDLYPVRFAPTPTAPVTVQPTLEGTTNTQ